MAAKERCIVFTNVPHVIVSHVLSREVLPSVTLTQSRIVSPIHLSAQLLAPSRSYACSGIIRQEERRRFLISAGARAPLVMGEDVLQSPYIRQHAAYFPAILKTTQNCDPVIRIPESQGSGTEGNLPEPQDSGMEEKLPRSARGGCILIGLARIKLGVKCDRTSSEFEIVR